MRADVAIVGAGTAGAAAAVLCARAGLSVVCVERRALGEAGARWVNGVAGWCFDEAGLERPRGAELRDAGAPFHLVAGWGPRRITVAEHDVLGVDMRLLVARLQRLAQEAGATLIGTRRVTGLDARGLSTDGERIEARVVVDASGLGGCGLLGTPKPAPRDVCAAAQQVRRVKDAAAARAFFEEHAAEPGETLCFTGVAGGYSIVNVRLDDDGVSLLTGSIPADGHASGLRLLDDFVAKQPWIGEVLFGGSRAIPLARPHDRLASERVALLGDAACQVFAAHGSGIGSGLVAARVLADALGGTGDPRRYAVAWMRRWGGLHAGYELLRRFSQRLGPGDVERLMSSGLLDADTAKAGMEQRFPALGIGAARRLAALLREPSLARRMARVGVRLAAAQALYARYPERAGALRAWSRIAGACLGSD